MPLTYSLHFTFCQFTADLTALNQNYIVHLNVPYARHYKPRLVYFLPHFLLRFILFVCLFVWFVFISIYILLFTYKYDPPEQDLHILNNKFVLTITSITIINYYPVALSVLAIKWTATNDKLESGMIFQFNLELKLTWLELLLWLVVIVDVVAGPGVVVVDGDGVWFGSDWNFSKFGILMLSCGAIPQAWCMVFNNISWYFLLKIP